MKFDNSSGKGKKFFLIICIIDLKKMLFFNILVYRHDLS